MKKLYKIILSGLLFLMITSLSLSAQVSINSTGDLPDNSAMLDVKSANKGFLPPRVALTAVNSADPVILPATGLLVYNTANAGTPPNNVIPGYYYWNGTLWVPIATPQGTNPGDMLYWNGFQWLPLPLGSPGQFLQLSLTNMPVWSGSAFAALTTTSVSSITSTTATSGGNISNDGGSAVSARGVCWSTSANPTTTNDKTTDGAGTGTFTSSITGLEIGNIYYVRAYATNSAGTVYGDEKSFTALVIGDSYLGGKVAYILQPGDPGYAEGKVRGLLAAPSDQSTGVTWGCQGTAIIGADATVIGTGNQNTIEIISGCTDGGIAAELAYNLTLNGYSDWYLPSKDELNKLYINKAGIGGFSDNKYWSSTEYFEFLPDRFAFYQNFLDGVQAGDWKIGTYNVRVVRAFGMPPLLVPDAPTIGTASLAYVQGTVQTFVSFTPPAFNGGTPITQYTVTSNPGGFIGTGTVSPIIVAGLTIGTPYTFTITATNEVGTSLASGASNSVTPVLTLPFSVGSSFGGGIVAYILQPGDPGYIEGETHGLIAASYDQSTGVSWGCQGTIVGANGAAIGTGNQNTIEIINGCTTGEIAAEPAYNLNLNGYSDWYLPSQDELNKLYINKTVIGDFSKNRYWSSSEYLDYLPGNFAFFQSFSDGLQGGEYKNTPYSVRAIRSFPSLATVTTSEVYSIAATSVTTGGNVTLDGGLPVTARGVCWSTSSNPTIANSFTTDGSGTGIFTSNLTGLSPNMLYYTRAYATNSIGTSYGNELNFTTLWACGATFTINHVAGSIAPVTKTVTYGTVTNIPGEPSKCWISQNLGADHQATAFDDATEAAAGWYWQFNIKQGYKIEGDRYETIRTPDTEWINYNGENSDWIAENDPCTLELGSGWRIPTSTEWANVDASGDWKKREDSWNSNLKLHPPGYLPEYDGGRIRYRGYSGGYSSSTQTSVGNRWHLGIDGTQCGMFDTEKMNGFSLRCIKD